VTNLVSDIQQDIIDRAGQRLADEIDFTILTDMLCTIGWTKVVLNPMTWEHGALIDSWVESNVKGHFETMGLVWVFEDAKDAAWFVLRWSN
jgi:hypothetical protein